MRSSANPPELTDVPHLRPRVGHGADPGMAAPRGGRRVEDIGRGRRP